MLPPVDLVHLQERAPGYEVSSEAGMICVLIPSFNLPTGFDQPQADLLLRLAPGYPDVPPDMWWFNPPVRRIDGTKIPATDVQERHLGRDWQRWSRHLLSGQWRSGIDSLESYLALVKQQLQVAAPKVVA